ncbi:MAG: site-specific integrase [Planctomycetota bacterium]
MASRSMQSNGHTWVFVKAANGKRRAVRLGELSRDDSEEAHRRLNKVEAHYWQRTELDSVTREWLRQLPQRSYDAVARTGLIGEAERRDAQDRFDGKVEGRAKNPSPAGVHRPGTVGRLIEKWKATLDVADSTQKNYQQHCRMIEDYFGADKLVEDIIPADADAAKQWAREHGSVKKGELSRASVSRAVKTWRKLFDFAVRLRWIRRDPSAPIEEPTNPFAQLRAEGEFNEERNWYVTSRLVDKLIELSPEPEVRAMLALSRYATFRGPSEFSSLHWSDIDFHAEVVVVTSPKTTRHRGGLRRTTPLEGMALRMLDELWRVAPEGETRALPKLGGADHSLIAQQIEALCRQIGVALWDKPFTNMRASCETDWQENGIQAMQTAEWMGHSAVVALQHYNRIAKDRVADLPSALLRGPEAHPKRAPKRSATRSTAGNRERPFRGSR